ncbi:hypothetical protein H632_c555p0 [Helicosporidium sp. ATCC 50920]|nr:hypothetical protein H632_c555p0 [Helicosporidium sp. ATCC 50920]|eukprot:KDD75679.1 hypothetical protein H632_c555p0 [Helicosporidium sp. ATCC 50920]
MRRVLLVAAFVAVGLVVSLHARPLDQGEGEENFHKPWHKPAVNQKPLIGILAQACHHCPGRSYVAAGFVKWIEAAGGRPVPVKCVGGFAGFYSSDEELERLFKSINGLIFPGGLTNLWLDDPYVLAARKLWTWAKERNDKGDVFPIHGTCLGFQLLHLLETNVNYTDMLVRTESVSQAAPMCFTKDAKKSTLFSRMDEDLWEKLEDPAYNISMENHYYGLLPEKYDTYPMLRERYNILSTAVDRNGTEYITSAESKEYPFFATQWHPEKPPYEFGNDEIPHSVDAIRVSQQIANTFVDIARRSSHVPESKEEELAMLIYNTKPYFTLKDKVMDHSYDGPDMTYFFDNPTEVPVNQLPNGRQAASTDFGMLDQVAAY